MATSEAIPPIGLLGRSVMTRRRGALLEVGAEWFIRATGLLTVLLLVSILVLLARQGVRLFLDLDYPIDRFFTYGNAITDNTTDPNQFRFGVMPPLIATFWVTLVTLIFAIPLGLMTAAFISEIAHPRVRLYIKSAAELLAGVPTIIFAFVGLALVVPRVNDYFGWGAGGFSGLTAGFVVSFVAVPLIISISDDAMQAVPVDYKENAYALGCNKLQAIWCVIMPAAISGISAAIMLGMARAIGETMIVVILAGGNSSLPHDPTESMRPMTATIAAGFGNASDQSLVRPALYMIGAILFLLTFATTLIADAILERQRKRFGR
ncbi:MAG: phosphate ABC transporter permease subunit PstC [Chloroflexi bacterium]|nr:MAG: phosphate ABC transporter permease subunit PstC [Chloroflexota bacterium]